jgi:hypothetical protein
LFLTLLITLSWISHMPIKDRPLSFCSSSQCA